MTDTSTTPATEPQTNVVSQVDALHQEAVESLNEVKRQLAGLRADRDSLAGRIRALVGEEEKLSRIVRNLEKMTANGDQ